MSGAFPPKLVWLLLLSLAGMTMGRVNYPADGFPSALPPRSKQDWITLPPFCVPFFCLPLFKDILKGLLAELPFKF